jgi:hypothetical protein
MVSDRPQDDYPYDRNLKAAIWRTGTIASVSGDGTRLTVNVPGGQVTNVMFLTSVTTTVGARVALLLDSKTALAIGLVK